MKVRAFDRRRAAAPPPPMPHALKQLLADPTALFGVIVIAGITLAALLAPALAPYPPDEQFFDGLTLEGAPLPPNERFWLGTDLLGRDLLSRLIFGARTSLIIGIVANGVAVLTGTLLGVVAGWLRRLDRAPRSCASPT